MGLRHRIWWFLFFQKFIDIVIIILMIISKILRSLSFGSVGYFWHFVAGKQFVSVYVFYYTLWLLLYFPSNDNNIVRNYECFVCVSQLIRVINGTIETQWDRTVKRMEFNIPSCASNRGQLSQMRIYMNKVKYWWFFCNLIFQVYKLMKMMIDAGNLVQELLYDFAQNGDCFPESRIHDFTVVFFHLILFFFRFCFPFVCFSKRNCFTSVASHKPHILFNCNFTLGTSFQQYKIKLKQWLM